MTHVLGSGTVSERLHTALPALIVVTTAAGIGRVSSTVSSYADGRITPLLITEADIALVAAVCRVESSAYGEDGFGTWTTLAWLAATGRVALPVAATAVVAVQTTLAALSQSVMHGAAMFHTSLYLADMRSFLDMAGERAPKRGELILPERVDEIRLDEAVYRYPGKEEPAVAGVSLTLRRGEILAVVGENGSGKSTLAKLFTGILLADKGRVLWDCVDLAQADPDAVWKRTARSGRGTAPAARHPPRQGAVGRRRTLRRPVATARVRSRALPPDPALDPGRAITEIKQIAAERMTIVVTHQLENTRLADRIVVMDKGRVIEQGTYEDR